MNIKAVFGKARLLRALTSLDRVEFTRLEEGMDQLLAEQRAERRHDGLPRQRAFGAGGPGKLPTTRARRLFLLFYFKYYPLQEVLAFLFGMSQPQAGEWIKKLTPLVNTVLGAELLLPTRRPADLETLLAQVPEWRLLVLDGVERPVRRPKDPDDQKKNYSGKKKAHRKKNRLIASEKWVVYLGPTSPGSVHDKKLADESGLCFPGDALVVKDTGFQGYEPPDTQTLQPKEKPRGRELHPIQKTINQLISKVRVTVEHAIAGIKRCHIVSDLFRNRRQGFVDEVMLAASGLHNLHVQLRPLPTCRGKLEDPMRDYSRETRCRPIGSGRTLVVKQGEVASPDVELKYDGKRHGNRVENVPIGQALILRLMGRGQPNDAKLAAG